MYQAPPTFNGFDPIQEPVEVFLQQLVRYFAINDIEKNRWPVILDTLIEEPALTLYNTAITNNPAQGGMRNDIVLAADANAAAIRAEMDARYTARTQWLRDNYNGQNQQEILQELLSGMYQGLKEDPKTFYLRITVQACRAGYAGAVMDVMVKRTFLAGIHKDIADKLSEQPRYELGPTVELANRIWNNAHNKINQKLTMFPQQIIEQNNDYSPVIEPTKTILARNPSHPRLPRQDTEGYLQDEMTTTTPSRHRRTNSNYEQDLDEVIGRMKKLEAHLFQNQRQSQGPERRIDYRDNRRPYIPPKQAFTQREGNRVPVCFQCGEEGHYKRDCQTETTTVAAPSNRYQRNQINIIGDYLSDPDSDYERNVVNRSEYFSDGRYNRRYQEEDLGLYPIHTDKKDRKKPYAKEPEDPYRSIIKKNTKEASKSTPKKPENLESMDETIDITPDIESNRERKLRRTKKHEVDFYQLIRNLPVTMTLEDALKTFPPAKQQVRAGIANLGPGFTMVETGVQSVENNSSDDSSEYSSEEFSDSSDESESDKETRKHVQKKIEAIQKKDKNYKTSAYLDVLVQSVIGRGIADTGAGKTVISEAFMNCLGWSIDKPTKIAFTVATGEKATALGIIKNVPVTVGGLTIPISAIVSTLTSYDILLGNDWLIKANAVIDLTNTKLTISAHNQEVSVNINLESGSQNVKKNKQKRNFEINQLNLESDSELSVDDWCPFDDKELTNPWWQEETIEQDYQSSVGSFERIELPELPGWETEPHPWHTAGAVDNTEWLKQETPSSSHLKPIEFNDKELCPTTRRIADNLKKGRCPHGQRFYHAESSCFSCNLETAVLDQKFWNKKLAQEEDRSEPDSDSTSEPWIDTCTHDVPIDDYHWCQDCESYSEARKNAEEIAPEYPIDYDWINREQERQEILDLKSQRKLEAIRDGKRKTCNHRHRNSQGCWNCDAEQATIQENLHRQQRMFMKHKTHNELSPEEIYKRLFNPSSVKAWRDKFEATLNEKISHQQRRYSTTVEDADLDLQDFGIKPKQASRKTKEQSDLEEFFDIGRLQPRPRENLHEDYNWRLNPSQKKNRVFKKPRISRAIQTNLVQILQEDLSEDEETKAEITVKKMCEDSEIIIPKKKHNADAGYDLQSRDTTKIPPGGMMLMRTGLSFGIPEGYFGLIKARSSLAIAGLSVEGGVIDSGYDGEIIVILVN